MYGNAAHTRTRCEGKTRWNPQTELGVRSNGKKPAPMPHTDQTTNLALNLLAHEAERDPLASYSLVLPVDKNIPTSQKNKQYY